MMYKRNPKLLNQFQYCEKEAVPIIIIVGEDEKAQGGVKIRETESRNEVNNVKYALFTYFVYFLPRNLYCILIL